MTRSGKKVDSRRVSGLDMKLEELEEASLFFSFAETTGRI